MERECVIRPLLVIYCLLWKKCPTMAGVLYSTVTVTNGGLLPPGTGVSPSRSRAPLDPGTTSQTHWYETSAPMREVGALTHCDSTGRTAWSGGQCEASASPVGALESVVSREGCVFMPKQVVAWALFLATWPWTWLLGPRRDSVRTIIFFKEFLFCSVWLKACSLQLKTRLMWTQRCLQGQPKKPRTSKRTLSGNHTMVPPTARQPSWGRHTRPSANWHRHCLLPSKQGWFLGNDQPH